MNHEELGDFAREMLHGGDLHKAFSKMIDDCECDCSACQQFREAWDRALNPGPAQQLRNHLNECASCGDCDELEKLILKAFEEEKKLKNELERLKKELQAFADRVDIQDGLVQSSEVLCAITDILEPSE